MTTGFTVIRDTTPAATIPRGAVVAMGNFDGVHLGHRAVIDAALRMGRAHGKPAFAVTFEPHPRSFFSPNSPQFRLSDEANKLRLLAGTGLDGAVVMTFDKGRAGTSAQDFINHDLIERLGISGIAVGYDFHFGKGRRLFQNPLPAADGISDARRPAGEGAAGRQALAGHGPLQEAARGRRRAAALIRAA
jgi:riboflavin kinase/FMN adenylyltransferase